MTRTFDWVNIFSYLKMHMKADMHTKRKGRSVLNGKRIFRHPKTNSFAAAVCRVEKRNCYSFPPSLLPPNCCFSKPFKLFCIRSRVVRSLKTSVRCVFVPCCMYVVIMSSWGGSKIWGRRHLLDRLCHTSIHLLWDGEGRFLKRLGATWSKYSAVISSRRGSKMWGSRILLDKLAKSLHNTHIYIKCQDCSLVPPRESRTKCGSMRVFLKCS